MVTIQRVDMPRYLESLGELDLTDFLDKENEEFYEFIFNNYSRLLPNDSVTLHDIMDDITPQILLEYFIKKGYVKLC